MVDAGVLPDDKATEVLQSPYLRKPRDRARQAHRKRRRSKSAGSRIAENASLRVIHRPLNQFNDGLVAVGTGLRVEAERTLAVLNPCVQRPAVRAKTEAEKVVVVGTVADQKCSVFLPSKLLFCFYSCNWTPVPTVVD